VRPMFIDNEDKVDITGPHPLTAETKHHQTTSKLRVTGNDKLLSNKLRPLCPHSKEQALRNRSTPTQLYPREMPPPPYQLNRRVGEPHNFSAGFEKEKSLLVTSGIEQILGSPALKSVTVPT
jgi:hypothetical protein